MDANWTRDVARKAAVDKVRAAEVMLRDAHDIFVSNDFSISALNAQEALTYTAEIE